MLDISIDNGILRFAGSLSIARISETERALHDILAGEDGALVIDLSRVTRTDTIGAWMVHRLLRDRPGSRVEGASPGAERLIAEVAAAAAAAPTATVNFFVQACSTSSAIARSCLTARVASKAMPSAARACGVCAPR
jgi:hypothetical protein